jgi:hypothetical protein
MAKSQDAKKTAKKEPLKTAKEKKEEKRSKKNSPKTRIIFVFFYLQRNKYLNSALKFNIFELKFFFESIFF